MINSIRSGLRPCPICNRCGSKKFKVLEKQDKKIKIECVRCLNIFFI